MLHSTTRHAMMRGILIYGAEGAEKGEVFLLLNHQAIAAEMRALQAAYHLHECVECGRFVYFVEHEHSTNVTPNAPPPR